MSSYSSSAFSTSAFSATAFDFGGGPPPAPAASSATPGFVRALRGMRAVFRGESDEERAERHAKMYPAAPPPAPPVVKRKGPPGPARWKKR